MFPFKDNFYIIKTISESQDSKVFHAQKKDTNDFFLIKSLKDRKDSFKNIIDRKILFRKEITITSSLDHPNIVKLADTYFDGETYYLIYPYREGKTLSIFFREGIVFSAQDSINLILQLLDALEYIHLKGIIHCDINPNNIFVDNEKGITLLDFGYSMTEEEALKSFEERIVGTPPFLSLEQIGFTDYKIDARSDLFCTAFILYRLLAGKLPFSIENDSIEELLSKIPKAELEPIRELPAILNAILIKALSPSPDDRYQTATGFKNDLKVALDILNGKPFESFSIGTIDNITAINRKKLFISRENEIAALQKGLEQSSKGRAVSFLFYGKSGSGKTYIVDQFRTKINENDFYFLSSKCNRFTPSQPYSIYRHIILDFISKISSCSNEEVEVFKEILDDIFLEHSGIICRMIPEMKEYFTKIKKAIEVEKEKEADLINYVLMFLLKSICEIKPLVIFIDDLQWIDQTTFEIIRNILKMMPQGMLIFNFRTKKSDEDIYIHSINLRKIGITNTIPVNKFTKKEIEELIFLRFGDIEKSDALVDILYNKTDAYPFTLNEAIRYLVNNSIVYPEKNGWNFDKKDLDDIPGKFDPASLILDKLRRLNENEKKYLELASLIEGKFERAIIENVGDFDPEISKTISNRLESFGFIVHQLSGGYSFSHDRVKEVISNHISKNDHYILNEKLALIYESLIPSNKEYLFNATECYLKSKNLTKSIEFSYEAAAYAAKKTAFDGAIHYFKFTMLMASQCPLVNLPVPVDMIKVRLAFGDVLMLTGKNQQALNMFEKLLKEESRLDENQILEIKYKIGSIYHNMGEFEHSIPYFKDALEKLTIKLPEKKLILIDLLYEIFKQLLFSFGFKHFLPPKNRLEDFLIVKILNKLGYSLYFEDMNLAFYTHFKALNISNCINNSYEKIETYSLHGVPAYQLFLKKRAFKYLKNSLQIAKSINRNDSYAFTLYVNGIVNYFNCRWKECINCSHSSLEIFNNIGDLSSQPQCAEPIWKVHLIRGELDSAEKTIHKTIELCKKANEKHFFVTALAGLYYIEFLRTGESNNKYLDEINNLLKQIDSLLSYTDVNVYLIKVDILQCKISQAYERINSLLSRIKKKDFNSEYYVPYYSLMCELINKELYNIRNNKNAQLPLSKKQLKKKFYANLFILWFSCLSYPAYWGAFYRNLTWHNALKGKKKKAKKYFLKAIQKHHSLDMRYEEAKSIRDYGLFLDDCNLPGEARDQYNAAYKLFHICGAKLETDRLKEKVGYDKKTLNLKTLPKEEKEEKKPESTIRTASQLRVDTLYDVSSSITEIDDIELLFRQILNAMIKATGAQYAWLFLEGSKRYDIKELCIDFHGQTHNKEDIPFSKKIVRRVKEKKKVELIRDVSQEKSLLDEEDTGRIDLIRSVLCVPLCHLDNYLGCVYLGNNIVSGLFSEESKKTVQILSAQAGVLLENAYLMDEYKKLNKDLQIRVNDQTKDIRKTNMRLIDANLKLMDSERMKNLLTGTIVHDIKNYAAGIEGNISVLSRRHPENQSIKRTLSLVKNTCFDIVNLSSNLLDIGKMEESKIDPHKTLINYKQICEIINQFKSNVLFEEKNISIKVIPPLDKFTVEADIYLLNRVFQNLFNNAAKYAPKNGKVVISMESGTEEDVICFFSSGEPIPEKDKEIIFDKYSSLDDNRNLHSKGLGLFFCRLVANAHQGRIWLDTDEHGNYFKMAFTKTPVKTTVL